MCKPLLCIVEWHNMLQIARGSCLASFIVVQFQQTCLTMIEKVLWLSCELAQSLAKDRLRALTDLNNVSVLLP